MIQGVTNAAGTLYLLRHGESEWNRENRFTGWADVPLTAQGVQEMETAGEKLRGVPIRVIYTSSLLRTWESARIIRAVVGLGNAEIIPTAELNERHYGELQGLNKEETAARYGEEKVRQWRRSYTAEPPGGESLRTAAESRILPFFERVVAPRVTESGEAVFVCAHGNTLRAIIMWLEALTEDEVERLEPPNGGLYRYSPKRGGDEKGAVSRRRTWEGKLL